MLVTYLRSSSIGSFSWCEHCFGIETQFGIKRGGTISASVGSAVHKALELLARQKQSLVANEPAFFEPELGLNFSLDDTPRHFLDCSLEYYSKEAEWDADAPDRAWTWLTYALECNGGRYDPRNLDIVAPEQFFDLEIREPWAWYDYQLPDGSRLKGFLRIKGTVDLLTRTSPGLLHYIDWKTGKRMNWTTKRAKTSADLRKDPQFLLYYYALRRLYPDDQVFFTIFFTADGGPFPICFDDSDIAKALGMLKEQFQLIQRTTNPSLAEDSKAQVWKCKRCSFYDTPYKDSGKTVCGFFRDELQQLGMEKVMARYSQLSGLGNYGSGGGRNSVDSKEL